MSRDVDKSRLVYCQRWQAADGDYLGYSLHLMKQHARVFAKNMSNDSKPDGELYTCAMDSFTRAALEAKTFMHGEFYPDEMPPIPLNARRNIQATSSRNFHTMDLFPANLFPTQPTGGQIMTGEAFIIITDTREGNETLLDFGFRAEVEARNYCVSKGELTYRKVTLFASAKDRQNHELAEQAKAKLSPDELQALITLLRTK